MNKVLLLGGIILDRYFEVESYPRAGQDAVIRDSFERVGGCALNVAITLKNLSAEPHIVSKLGDDETGRQIEAYLHSIPLPTDCVAVTPGQKTGYCLTILDASGERTFLTYAGHEKHFSAEIIPPTLASELAYTYVTGYYLLNRDSTAMMLKTLESIKNTGCSILFDPGPLVGSIDPRQLQEMILLTTVMTPNMHELTEIQNTLGFAGDPAEYLQGKGVQHLVVKKGTQGVTVHSRNGVFDKDSFKVNTVDSTGAGDSFAGGLIHALIKGMSLKDAVDFASACGAYTTTITGPHGFFSEKDIIEFISSHKEAKK